jgi:predicted transcriptional regulator
MSRVGKPATTVRIDPKARQVLTSQPETRWWQIDHIRQGLREARAEEFVAEPTVKSVIDRRRRR